jgi:class 3 adenylate cyclase
MVASFGITPGRLPPQVSALLATHAGLELMDYVAELNKERSKQDLANLNLSVGIATGLVRGHEKQNAEDTPYPFMGDVVRTAQRLQQFTVALNSGGVLISEETYNFIKTVLHQFSFGRQGPVKFPWESEPKMVYEVVERSQTIFEPNWELRRLPKVTSRRALISRTAWTDIGRG